VTEPKNQVEYRVLAMRRSGHHAVINWMIHLCDGARWCHLNDPPMAKGNPFDHTQDIFGEKGGRRDILLYNVEDVEIAAYLNSQLHKRHDEWFGTSRRVVYVLIMRDVFNLHASRRAKQVEGHTWLPFRPDVYKSHAREFLGLTRMLDGVLVPVNYNRWVSSRRYRRELAAALGLRFRRGGVRHVAHIGSSFDGFRFHGKAHKMDLSSRWRRFADDEVYLDSLADPELIGLSTMIFGCIRGTDQLPWCRLHAEAVNRVRQSTM
jgi:hypothetical protein